jgi:hypothetical protein
MRHLSTEISRGAILVVVAAVGMLASAGREWLGEPGVTNEAP